MPSARELLEQADALMRRNRAGVIDTEIPELTEIVAMVALAPAAAPPVALSLAPPAAPSSAPPAAPSSAPPVTPPAAPAVLDDVPELTEAVEEIEIESIVELPEDLAESSSWLHHDHGELSVIGGGASSVAPGLAKTSGALDVEVAVPAAAAAGVPAADEWARWEVLADEIRMQVLQRIDIFADTRLRDQLSALLQPIVDRASAEMVSTINAQVGGLLRAHIAEAIEREIEKWRGAER